MFASLPVSKGVRGGANEGKNWQCSIHVCPGQGCAHLLGSFPRAADAADNVTFHKERLLASPLADEGSSGWAKPQKHSRTFTPGQTAGQTSAAHAKTRLWTTVMVLPISRRAAALAAAPRSRQTGTAGGAQVVAMRAEYIFCSQPPLPQLESLAHEYSQ